MGLYDDQYIAREQPMYSPMAEEERRRASAAGGDKSRPRGGMGPIGGDSAQGGGILSSFGPMAAEGDMNIEALRRLARGEDSMALAQGQELADRGSAMQAALAASAGPQNAAYAARNAASQSAMGQGSVRGATEQARMLEQLRARELLGQAISDRYQMDIGRLNAMDALMKGGMQVGQMPSFGDQLMQGGAQAVASRYGQGNRNQPVDVNGPPPPGYG